GKSSYGYTTKVPSTLKTATAILLFVTSERKRTRQMQTPAQSRSANVKTGVIAANGRRALRPVSRAKKANKLSDGAATIAIESSKPSKSAPPSSVGMFSPGEARCDRWQELAHAAQTLVAQSSAGAATKETLAVVEA